MPTDQPLESRFSNLPEAIRRLRGGLVVSCQAGPDEPLFGAAHMAALAKAALQGGAVGIRSNGPEDIAAIRAAVALPIIGIYKVDIPASNTSTRRGSSAG
jgi:putative N-acetylmannosamine-6-phosphate epimerase